MQGLVIKNIANHFCVMSGNRVYEATAAGKLKQDDRLLVGDEVEFEVLPDGKASITKLYSRKNQLIRPPISNIDNLIILIAPVPEPDFVLIDKMLLTCFINGINPILCFNKIDLADEEYFKKIANQYEDIVEDIIYVSAAKKSNLKDLYKLLENKLSAFSGQSAVGKSTLINALLPGANAKIGELSKKKERGKQTTRHTEIYPAENGIKIADTPGFSLLNLMGIESGELKLYYPEFSEVRCKYSGCLHISEDSSVCAVKTAVKNKKINAERYNRYVKLYEELKKEKKFYGKN